MSLTFRVSLNLACSGDWKAAGTGVSEVILRKMAGGLELCVLASSSNRAQSYLLSSTARYCQTVFLDCPCDIAIILI